MIARMFSIAHCCTAPLSAMHYKTVRCSSADALESGIVEKWYCAWPGVVLFERLSVGYKRRHPGNRHSGLCAGNGGSGGRRMGAFDVATS